MSSKTEQSWSESRLDKLLRLLASRNRLLRDQAARTLGELQRNSADDQQQLANGLLRLYSFSCTLANWDALNAVANAIGHMLAAAKFHNQEGIGNELLGKHEAFDVRRLLAGNPRALLACEGRQFAVVGPLLQDMKTQRKEVDRHLELHSKVGIRSSEWVADDDLKVNGRKRSIDDSGEDSEDSEAKVVKLESERALFEERIRQADSHASIVRNFATLLVDFDLKSPRWERRYAVAAILKSVLMQSASIWSQDNLLTLAASFFEVVALDRFNDFVGTEGAAPVREMCAQVLAVVMSLANHDVSAYIANGIHQLLEVKEHWECRQGALIVLKYVVAVRTNMNSNSSLLSSFLPSIVSCMTSDNSDDVSSAACRVLADVDSALIGNDRSSQLWDPAWDTLQRIAPGDVITTSSQECRNVSSFSDGATAAVVLKLVGRLWSRSGAQISDVANVDRRSLLMRFTEHSSADVRKIAVQLLCDYGSSCGSVDQLTATVRMLLRRILLEPPETRIDELCCSKVEQLLIGLDVESVNGFVDAVCPSFGAWLAATMVLDDDPAIDLAQCDLLAEYSPQSVIQVENNENQQQSEPTIVSGRLYVCGSEVRSLSENDRLAAVVGKKFLTCRALACIADKISRCTKIKMGIESPAESLRLLLLLHLNSNTLLQKFSAALLVLQWAQLENRNSIDVTILDAICSNLESDTPVVLEEMTMKLAELNRHCVDFVDFCRRFYGAEATIGSTTIVTSTASAEQLCRGVYESASLRAKKPERQKRLTEQWEALVARIAAAQPEIRAKQRRLNVVFAAAVVNWGRLTSKLTPLIRSLTDAAKEAESVRRLADVAAVAIARLLLLTESRTPCPNAKLIRNLASLHCGDPNFTPELDTIGDRLSIFLLSPPTITDQDVCLKAANSRAALQSIVRLSGFDGGVSKIWLNVESASDLQEIRLALQTLETAITAASDDSICRPQFDEMTSRLLELLSSESASLRHLSARGLIAFARHSMASVLNAVLPTCLGGICDADNSNKRAGCVELFALMSERLEQASLVGSCSLFAPSLLARMSDPLDAIRETAARGFANFVQLVPLESEGVGKKSDFLNDELKRLLEKNRHFLSVLSDPSSLPLVDISELKLQNVSLRPYQVEGLTWLRFLDEYGLHGMLCDDMGLGKTLQALCALQLSADKVSSHRRSLIVCPGSVVEHWRNEIYRYFGVDGPLRPVCVFKANQHPNIPTCANVVIISYAVLRRDSGFWAAEKWHYCILDEGHVVRNPKTVLFTVVTALQAEHRLILSGTPVQNSVTDLWSLFRFLMPGYLGTQQQFNARYAKVILASRDAKASSKDADAGEKALAQLHKQVLPLIMRRLKADVLKDLPPKIIEDYYCQLTPVQRTLYERLTNEVSAALKQDEGGARRKNCALSILQYLRQLCDHPRLVSDKQRTTTAVTATDADYRSIEASGKLIALRQLLSECGIGNDDGASGDEVTCPSSHRALIFCQFKSVISLLEEYLRNGVFGRSTTWLKLDGSVPIHSRQSIVDKFNQDPAIDLLLLTTQVGGLGLNLTGADVVIFVDHDWNPAKDLQAVDRAHRLGQRKTVNVYRLITKGTLEEKIMRLQRFKMNTSQAIIGAENSSMLSMATDQLMELLTLDDEDSNSAQNTKTLPAKSVATGTSAVAKVVGAENDNPNSGQWNLTDLWEQTDQYSEQFDVESFLADLKRS